MPTPASLITLIAITLSLISATSTFSISIKQIDNSGYHQKRNLLMLVKRKFQPLADPYVTDDIEAKYLRTSDYKCVLKKLNLIDDPKISREELKHFDVRKPFGSLAQDMNLIVVVVMQFCMDEFDEYSQYTFEKGIESPIVQVPLNATECAISELFKLHRQKPLFEGNFWGLRLHTKDQCDAILRTFLNFIDDFDTKHYRGCMKDHKSRIAEYLLKFRIMHNDKTSGSIKQAVRDDYMKNNNDKEGDAKVVDCLIEKYNL
ncbi:unnamed protein product [Chironomus riparius]|uniref:Uncharacterized protein n=1 Tax=Chironomus riparius TaxID=315576 RepID=A0A9N9WYN4_9DIPT|nr:unnamed protein product [Chironomus riparius]